MANVRMAVRAKPTDLWTTPAVDTVGKHPSTERRGWTQRATIARLRNGVSITLATAETNTDAITYLAAAAILLLVSAIASLLPPARAAPLEPVRTLRSQ